MSKYMHLQVKDRLLSTGLTVEQFSRANRMLRRAAIVQTITESELYVIKMDFDLGVLLTEHDPQVTLVLEDIETGAAAPVKVIRLDDFETEEDVEAVKAEILLENVPYHLVTVQTVPFVN